MIMKPAFLPIASLLIALFAIPPATAAQKTSKTEPHPSVVALLRKGLADLDRRDFDAAVKKFTQATKLSSDCRAQFLLGLAHYEKGSQGGDPDTADKREAQATASAYAKATASDPGLKAIHDPARFYKSLAWSDEVLRSYDQAAAAYESAAAAAPQDPMIPLHAAHVYSRMGAPIKAAQSLAASIEKARRLKQESLIIKTVRSNPRFSPMLVYPDVAAVLDEPAPVNDLVAKAEPRSGGEELRDAVSDRRPLSAQKPASAPPRACAVMSALAAGDDDFKFRQYQTAIDAYDAAVRLDAKAPALSPVQRAILYERMGTSYNRLGLAEEAVVPLQMSLQAMPNEAASHYQLALAYSLSGRFDESLSALAKAFESAPSRSELRKYLLSAKSDWELAPVRDLSGFTALLERSGRYPVKNSP
jgi:tetratricopeptide (TPR) repeat protein